MEVNIWHLVGMWIAVLGGVLIGAILGLRKAFKDVESNKQRYLDTIRNTAKAHRHGSE